MADRSETTIPACDWRVAEYCLRAFIQRLRAAVGNTSPSGGEAGNTVRLAIRTILGHGLETGAGLPRCRAFNGSRCPWSAVTPRYDSHLQVLYLGDVSVHEFSGQAGYVVDILEAFEAQGWPPFLVDPLGKCRNAKYGKWLKEAVYELNQCQKPSWLIHFHSRPKAHIVWWELRLP